MFLCISVIACAISILGIANGHAANLNQVPNSGFEGTGGDALGNVNGEVPDYWRAFGLEGGEVSIETMPLAANTLFPGSPPTNAVRLTFDSFGAAQGFDHEGTPFSLAPGHAYRGTVYMRSGNSTGASQGVTVSFPVFDVNGFTGREPGTFSATVTNQWASYSGPTFTEAGGTGGDLAFRLEDDGGENSVLIAMPNVTGPAPDTPEVTYPPIYTPGRDFSDTDRYVATAVFHWFNVFGGQKDGPWVPLEGRGNWSGEARWWREQIKDMMDANFDVLYVHLFNGFHYQREQFFQALHELRSEGYDTPYIVPFLDPQIIWNNNPIDMTQPSAKDEYVDWYTFFYEQYFSQDVGDYAESRLLHINGKVVLNTWVGTNTNLNYGALTRQDVESRLANALGAEYPSFNNGIYQISSTGGTMPAFSDEIAIQFSNTEYFSTWFENGKRNATMKGGYWDQNIRVPGIFFPRNGGAPYANAWDDLMAVREGGNGQPPIYHTYVESWNEYDEGSGIYAASTEPPYIAPGNTSGNDDTWSATDNPREYIDSTYEGASAFNDHPDRDSRFLWSDFPTSMSPGESATVQILVRNEGNQKWSQASGFRLSETANDHAWGPGTIQIDNDANEIAKYGGVFRGRPVLFEFTVTAPGTPGVYEAHYSMTHSGGTPFGEAFTIQVAVGAEDVQAGHSGAFYYPARDGEGNYVEILNENRAVVYTFSYRPDGSGPAWFIGVGDIIGGSIVIDDLLRPIGTSFGSGFNTNDIEFSQAGSMSMGFVDCPSNGNGGTVTYSGSEVLGFERLLSRAGRLSQITGCGSTPDANAGLSGSYYDPARDGEGIVVQWLTSGAVLVIMFTYDLAGNQFWGLGIGTPDGNTVTMDALYPATPTSWGSGFDPDEISLEVWGTFTLTWSGACNAMTFAYASTVSGYGSATRNYSRLTSLAETTCPFSQ